MAEAQVTETIRCTPDEMLEFVLDPHRYAQVDPNIGKIDWVHRDGDVVEFRFHTKAGGLPGPALTSRMRLTPGERVDAAPPHIPENRPATWFMDIRASWACRPAQGGTSVTRTARVDFKRPVRWLTEPIFRRTLKRDIERELAAAKAYLEGRR